MKKKVNNLHNKINRTIGEFYETYDFQEEKRFSRTMLLETGNILSLIAKKHGVFIASWMTLVERGDDDFGEEKRFSRTMQHVAGNIMENMVFSSSFG